MDPFIKGPVYKTVDTIESYSQLVKYWQFSWQVGFGHQPKAVKNKTKPSTVS